MSEAKLDQVALDVAEIKKRVEKLEVDMRASAQYDERVKRAMRDTAWRSRGGRTTAANMTAKERSQAASKAALARWAARKKENAQ